MINVRSALDAGARATVIAAIVATMLYLPLGILLSIALGVFGVPMESFVTFGGALGTVSGMLAWWLVAFAMALAYAVAIFVRHANMDGFDRSS